ncbi:MAG: penicillin-binding transpeptidase domain-containing protein [Thermodesulfobacteriota bacterium]
MTGPFGGGGPRLLFAAALLLVGGWGVARIVTAESGLHSPPAPAAASAVVRIRLEHGLPPQEIVDLVKSGEPEKDLQDGSRLVSTLNPELQGGIFDLFRRFDPPYGVFVAMEPGTGRVVALVGYRRGGISDPSLALKAIYPAASLIKVITASAAIERGNVSPDDEFSYRGGIYGISRRGIRAPDGRGGPKMSLEEAIARSANAVFGKVAVHHVGGPVLGEYLTKFGFGLPLPFDLPVEPSRAEVPREEYELARTGAGFGDVYVSPLHVAMIMSALASGGSMPRPLLVDRIEDADGDVAYESTPSKFRDTVRPETAEAVVQMMVKTVEMGTSRRAFGSPARTPLLQDMDVAGKTGSLSGWTPPMHFEWFAGVAPANVPKLAVAALVVNEDRWKIKGSYVGKEAFNAYFGYPSSSPPVYRKAGGRKHPKFRKSGTTAAPKGKAVKGKKSRAAGKRKSPAAPGKKPAGKSVREGAVVRGAAQG